MNEFEIIERCFARGTAERPDVVLGVGDDGALLAVAPGGRVRYAPVTWALGPDLADLAGAARLGPALIDAAAVRLREHGATPAWGTLALTLPAADDAWLAAFAPAFTAAARERGVTLVGGDTTSGPGSITLVLMGPSDD